MPIQSFKKNTTEKWNGGSTVPVELPLYTNKRNMPFILVGLYTNTDTLSVSKQKLLQYLCC